MHLQIVEDELLSTTGDWVCRLFLDGVLNMLAHTRIAILMSAGGSIDPGAALATDATNLIALVSMIQSLRECHCLGRAHAASGSGTWCGAVLLESGAGWWSLVKGRAFDVSMLVAHNGCVGLRSTFEDERRQKGE